MLPSTTQQRLFRAFFWVLLLYIAVTSTVVIGIQFQLIPVPKKSIAQEKTQKPTNPLLLSETSFTKLFAREYLSWDKEEQGNRELRLKSYWQKGIDPQGGLDFDQTTWNSYAQNIEVWKIEDHPEDKGVKEVTVFAETYLTKIANPDLQKRVDRYMVIPIKRAGASYRVVDIPYFIAPPVASKLGKKQEKSEDKGETVELSVKADVEKFLPAFWKAYTDDSTQGIRYLMKNNQIPSTLAGIMQFLESTKVEVYKRKDYYLVENDVVLLDLATNTKMSFHYKLKLVKEKNRWFILDIRQGEGL